MSRCHVRCRQCQARKVLKKHPEAYYRYSVAKGEFVSYAPACANCGGRAYRADRWMNERDTRVTSCYCNGYVMLTRRTDWPHRIGSPYCCYRKDGTTRHYGDADFKDYELEQVRA